MQNSALVCKIQHQCALYKHNIANLANFYADFFADFADFDADFCIEIPLHYNANANFLLCQSPHTHYNVEFHIVPYKQVSCGIINEFAQGWLKLEKSYPCRIAMDPADPTKSPFCRHSLLSLDIRSFGLSISAIETIFAAGKLED